MLCFGVQSPLTQNEFIVILNVLYRWLVLQDSCYFLFTFFNLHTHWYYPRRNLSREIVNKHGILIVQAKRQIFTVNCVIILESSFSRQRAFFLWLRKFWKKNCRHILLKSLITNILQIKLFTFCHSTNFSFPHFPVPFLSSRTTRTEK